MKFRLLFILLLSTSVFFSFNDQDKTIIFFGDSITAGYGLSKEQAFPALIENKLKSKAHKYRVINAGLSGETSAGGLSRIDWILRQPVDIFVLELGANDGLRGLPPAETKKNLQGIIDKVLAKNPNVKIVIAGMMVPPNLGQDYSKEFKSIFPELAKKNDALLIPFLLEGVAGDRDLNLADGIHPNVKGHEVVADNVYHALKGLL
ncbi:Arylesterase precursor [Fulvivirga imtechensis AK7]|uniref:Arylesterase n=1 Tax=Fulvivirga imtechensis AK7 TaxID=1237149 RepID=L8JYG0_9BACT|nr:arylesterase [Fulvivirga imtechensis]ELR73203.1 Arylesterase precursor [Fulvivirga imtechensis AK7]